MHDNDCSACNSIWREYAHAMAEHLKLTLQRYMAPSLDDAPDDLDALIAAAEMRSRALRATMRRHEAASHVSTVGAGVIATSATN